MPSLAVQSGKPDFAALGPSAVLKGRASYYRDCALLVKKTKSLLQARLAQNHDMYLMANATHALTTALYGLHQDGFETDIQEANYEPYAAIANNTVSSHKKVVKLVAHVNPVTGAFSPVHGCKSQISLLDATQSFATRCHHEDVLNCDIFFTSLHKHANLQPGMGVLAIAKHAGFPRLRKLASVNETSSKNLTLLQAVFEKLENTGEHLFNISRIELGRQIRSALGDTGIAIDANSPKFGSFVCLQNVPPDWVAPKAPNCLSLKYFKAQQTLRISTYVRGRLCDASADQTPLVTNYLKELVSYNDGSNKQR